MASSDKSYPSQKLNCSIPYIPTDKLLLHVEQIIDNLQSLQKLQTDMELTINVISIIVGSFVCKADFDNPSPQYPTPRNHECPTFVQNLVKNPISQISTALIEFIIQNSITSVNFNQYVFLIDPIYSNKEYAIPYGLASVFPSIMYNPIIAMNGFIQDENHSLITPIKYNSFLEPYIIPNDIDEQLVNKIIEKFQSLKDDYLLINLMDCSSNTLRKIWAQNTAQNVYCPMPDCLARDNLPMYMPIITISESDEWKGLRWINWFLDNELTNIYKLISPHTYTFLIHNYKRMVLETYFISICKILIRMRISLEYKLDDTTSIVFSKMSFQEFKELWISERYRFKELFVSFMDVYYKWNYYKFIEIMLDMHSFNPEPSMQKILLNYLEIHLKQLKAYFPDDSIPEYTENEYTLQNSIEKYLNENNIHC